MNSDAVSARKRPFSWFLLFCCIGVSLITARLGIWQLDRAQEKQKIALMIEKRMQATEWTLNDFILDSKRWDDHHHPVFLTGKWHSQLTFFLGNRTHHGKAGFWVFTPLILENGSWVLVKRGWSPRDLFDPTRTPDVWSDSGWVQIKGRIDPPPTVWMTLSKYQENGNIKNKSTYILDNVDIQSLSRRWQHEIKAVVLQTDATEPGLYRDWPAIDLKLSTHWGYAFQWFALSFTSVLLYLWYQWLKPFRET